MIEQKDLIIPEGPGSRLSEPYPFDKMLIQQYVLFNELLTDEIFYRLRNRCIEDGIPWISPDFYFPIFNLGMARIMGTTPDFTLEQCLAAKDPEDLRVAPSIASNLMMEYETKLGALRKIVGTGDTDPVLVKVNEEDLKQAEDAYRDFIGSGGLTALSEMSDAETQREYLKQFVARARQEVLPKIIEASRPVIEAGTRVLDIAYGMMNIEKDQSPPPKGLK